MPAFEHCPILEHAAILHCVPLKLSSHVLPCRGSSSSLGILSWLILCISDQQLSKLEHAHSAPVAADCGHPQSCTVALDDEYCHWSSPYVLMV